ncbi:hypothetical protein D3C72_1067440 [compost metagenome]
MFRKIRTKIILQYRRNGFVINQDHISNIKIHFSAQQKNHAKAKNSCKKQTNSKEIQRQFDSDHDKNQSQKKEFVSL